MTLEGLGRSCLREIVGRWAPGGTSPPSPRAPSTTACWPPPKIEAPLAKGRSETWVSSEMGREDSGV